jgi:hypothetical protein
MKNQVVKFLIATAMVLAPASALGFQARHQSMTQLRPLLGGDAYVSQQVQYTNSNSRFANGKDVANHLFQGNAFRASLGLEHLHFLQTGVYYANVNETTRGGDHAELRANEFGAEVKMVFTAPVVNLAVGGGFMASQGSYRSGNVFSPISSNGYFAAVEAVYFLSSRLSMNLSGGNYFSKSVIRNNSMTEAATQAMRVGGGICIWL